MIFILVILGFDVNGQAIPAHSVGVVSAITESTPGLLASQGSNFTDSVIPDTRFFAAALPQWDGPQGYRKLGLMS
jgi:hypothetical protein